MSDKFLKIECPSCQKRLKILQCKQDKKIYCPRCNSLFFVEILSNGGTSSRLIPERNNLFGPPVRREFLRGGLADSEFGESDSSEFLDSESQTSQAGDDPFEDLQVDQLIARGLSGKPPAETPADRLRVKAAAWKREHSEMQTPFDDACLRIGIGLVLLSLAVLIVPLMHLEWLRIQLVIQAVPTVGVILGLAGIALIALSMRRKWRRSLITALVLVLPISALGLYAELDRRGSQRRDNELADRSRTEPDFGQRNPEYGTPDWQVGRKTIENNPVEQFVPPTAHQAPRTIKGNPDRQSPEPAAEPSLPGSASSTTASGAFADQPAASTNFRPNDENYGLPPLNATPLNATSPFAQTVPKSTRSQEQVAAEIARATSLFQKPVGTFPQKSNLSKRQVLLNRIGQMSKGLVNHAVAQNEELAGNYRLSDVAGVTTVFGTAYYRDLPIMGIDVCTSGDRSLDQVVPVIGPPEFEDSLIGKSGYFLAGLNIHYVEQVLGIQAVFASADNGRLLLPRQVSSPWFGVEPANAQTTYSIDSGGDCIYGIVVYRNKLKIVGVSLVTSR